MTATSQLTRHINADQGQLLLDWLWQWRRFRRVTDDWAQLCAYQEFASRTGAPHGRR